MKEAALLVLAVLLISCASLAASESPRLLVKPRVGISLQQFDRILASYGAHRVGIIEKIAVHVVELSPQADAGDVIAALGKDAHIEFAEIDRRVRPIPAE